MAKYIDAERLKAEIERLYYNEAEKDESILAADAYKNALDAVEKFIDSLPDENNPEPYNPVYNEDYLNEKIAKATKSWEGVDVDKMLADCRGYEEKPFDDLEEAAEEAATGLNLSDHFRFIKGFKAGAEWQYQKDRGEFAKIKAKTWCEGYDAHEQQMLKDAVEGYVNYYEDSGGKLMAEAQVGCPYHMGDKVKIIIVKED